MLLLPIIGVGGRITEKCPDCNIELERKTEYTKRINQNKSFYECPSCKNCFEKEIKSNAKPEDICPQCHKPTIRLYENNKTGITYEACEYCGYEITDEDYEDDFDIMELFPSALGFVVAFIGFIIYILSVGFVFSNEPTANNLVEYVQNQRSLTIMGLIGMVAFMGGCIMQFSAILNYLQADLRSKRKQWGTIAQYPM